jgi:hypothetical protein
MAIACSAESAWINFAPRMVKFLDTLKSFDICATVRQISREGKQLKSTDSVFRDLFGDQTLGESQNISVKNITFLISDLKGSTALYDAVGDVRGYHLVRQHFAALARVVAGHSGAVVKTIGDEVMAAFADPVDAVSASIDIAREVEEMNRSHSDRLRFDQSSKANSSVTISLTVDLDLAAFEIKVDVFRGQDSGLDS